MFFNSFIFLWLFPIIFIVYWALTNKKGLSLNYPLLSNFFLIFTSYALYIKWKPIYAFILLGITIVSFLLGICLENKTPSAKKKCVFWCGVAVSLFPLLLFKYYNFISTNLEDGLGLLGIQVGLPGLNWIMPIGLSFFTLQAIGYIVDVYLGRIKAERNWWDYCLFICFFPQIVSGPISKANDLLPQIKAQRVFQYNQCVQGLKWFLWGLFIKIVVADRLGLVVDPIMNGYEHYSGLFCLIGSFFYTFQIYTDFAGYSFMAVGVGLLLGFNLVNNFNHPYFSQSITEFWHRWHISLSVWLRDNIYIPLGGSRCSSFRNSINILLTFLVSGIWHGANWTFILWGGIHGFVQVIEKRLGLTRQSFSNIVKFIRIIVTFIIVNFAWIFFRMPTITDALNLIKKVFLDMRFAVDVEVPTVLWCLILILLVVLKDFAYEKNRKSIMLLHHPSLIIRWSTYIVLIVMILFCSVFDASQFIYAMF